MSQRIVSDAGPLITFARAGRLELLQRVVGTLLVPEAVHHEIVVRGAGKPGAAEVASGSWVAPRALADRGAAAKLPTSLGEGEKEAVALCAELGACLLADDPVARREARARGILLISTLDILDEAKVRGLIGEVKPVLDRLIRTGFRLGPALYDAKLRHADES